MKAPVLFLFSILIASSAHAQIPVLYYDLENTTRLTGDLNPDQSIAPSSALLRITAGNNVSEWYTTGAGALYGGLAGWAYESNKWPTTSTNPGASASEYVSLGTSSLGIGGLTVSVDSKSDNGSGMKLGVAYSTNGFSWTAATTAPQSLTSSYATYQFSLPSAADNSLILFIKFYAYGAGNNSEYCYFDNVTVSATTFTSTKTLLNYANLGTGLTDGAAYTPTYNNLIINGTGVTITLNSDLKLQGSLTLTAGTVGIGANTLTLMGSLARTNGTIDASSGTLAFNGTAEQAVPAGSVGTTIKNLTVNNASGISINDNYTISAALNLQTGSFNLNGKTVTLGGTVSGTGVFKGSSASGLSIAGSGTVGTLNFDQTTDASTNALGALGVASGTVTLGSKLNIFTSLTLTGGSLDLGAKNLVLKSDVNQTAYVGTITGTLSGATNVTAERYIPSWSNRRYRLLTSPVSGVSINTAWQEGSTWNGTGSVASTGYGTLITGQQQGTAATANANGFDYWSTIANSSASVRSYVPAANPNDGTWQSIATTKSTTAFDNQEAYLVFVRGDRSVSSGSTPGATTLRPNGTLKTGSISINVPTTKSYTLIGNPYACPLDFKAIYDANSTKIKSSFYIWKSSLGTGTGGYVLVQPIAPGSGLYETIPGDGSQTTANRLIHSGEGFLLIPATGASSPNAITIQEAHKSTTTPTVSVYREMGNQPAKLYVNLFTTANAATTLIDGALSQYAAAFANGGTTVAKVANSGENLSVLKGSSDLIVTSGVVPRGGDTLQLRLWNTAQKAYRLDVRGLNFSSLRLTAVLIDQFLNKETALNLNDSTTAYPFSVTADAASKNPSRFLIVFRTLAPLPMVLTSIEAKEKETAGVAVNWQMADESGVQSYELEKSVDGTGFIHLATLSPGATGGSPSYTYNDANPSAINYYRVQMIGQSGETKYSDVVKLTLRPKLESLQVYPNPVGRGDLNLQLRNKTPGNYNLTLYSAAGQVVLQQSVQYTGATATYSLSLDAVGSGNYYLQVKDGSGRKTVLAVSVMK